LTLTPPVATEGISTGTINVANFSDPDTVDASNFIVAISWGDGTADQGTVVQDSAHSFHVEGSHTYAEEGANLGFNIAVHDQFDNSNDAANALINVADAALAVTATPPTAVEGTNTGSVAVATFMDANPNATTNDFSASIDWGDSTGADTNTQIVANADGSFSVMGSHTYAEEGLVPLKVTVSDVGGSTGSGNKSFSVTDAVLTVHVTAPTAFENIDTGTITVANFTDADPNGTLTDYQARIAWGDGTIDMGSILTNPDGSFSVQGRHTYTEEKALTCAVTVADIGGARTTAKATFDVADAKLTLTGLRPPAATEGISTGATTVATFMDANPNATADDFTATINWGDGLPTRGTVSFNSGTGQFEVNGDHIYVEDGMFLFTVTIVDAGGSTAFNDLRFGVNDATLAVTAAAPSPTIGVPTGTVSVATFTDANTNPDINDFSATINWGDGTSDNGTVIDNGNGTFGVSGNHTYANAGMFTLSATVNDAGGASATDSTPVTVAGLSVVTITQLTAPTPFEGISSGTVSVATFTDSDQSLGAGDFTASVDWGDGTTEPGTVIANGDGTFRVEDSHTYAEEGPVTFSVSVTDSHNSIGTESTTAGAVDAPLHLPGVSPPSAFVGMPTGQVTLATFTDTNPGGTVSDFSASVDWGDGTTDMGTIVSNADGSFSVLGNHTYTSMSTFTLAVTVTDVGGSAASASTSVDVSSSIFFTEFGAPSAREGAATGTVTVTTFRDINSTQGQGDFTATINWGDGTTDAGTILNNGDGTFSVTGDHTYREEGTFMFSVAVSNNAGSTTTASTMVVVPDAAITITQTTPLSAVSGVSTGTVALAIFTDANPNPDINDLSATVDWGDGTPVDTNITIVDNMDGTFSARGGHTYTNGGAFAYAITINDRGGASDSKNVSVTVSGITISNFSPPTGVLEGNATGTLTLATFNDSNSGLGVADFSATIHWGDGTSDAGTIVDNGNGTFNVTTSGHTYAEESSVTFSLTINDSTGASSGENASVEVADAALAVTVNPPSPLAGVPTGNFNVASFTDANQNSDIADFSATINWGDGSTTTGDVLPGGGGTFVVRGTHTYTNGGKFTLSVAVNDIGGASDTQSATVTVAGVTITELTAPSATEGIATGVFTAAIFTDSNPTLGASDFTATITWGDGAIEGGTIVNNGDGTFSVSGNHTYPEEGMLTFAVTVEDTAGATASRSASVSVADADLTITNMTAPSATEGISTGTIDVATFADANLTPDINDFSATIDWGDGTTDPGSIVANADGTFSVQGSHTYAEEGAATITVAIHDAGGSSTGGGVSLTVADAGLTLHLQPPASATKGVPTGTITVGTFTDANPNPDIHDFSATIDWGDGTTDPGTIVANGDGSFSVQGSHTYTASNFFTFAVTVNDVGGASANQSAMIDVPPSRITISQFTPPTAIEGQSTGTVTLATFTDTDTSLGAADFSAAIIWGDSPLAAGTIVDNGDGTFSVQGSHTYAEEGTFTFSVTIMDSLNAAVAQTTSINVPDAALTITQLAPPTATAGVPTGLITVATFTDANPNPDINDFSATISWGDGTPSAGTIQDNHDGTFAVQGSHTYASGGSLTFSVTVQDHGGARAMQSTSITVAGIEILELTPPTATEGLSTGTLTVATFQDSNTSLGTGDFSATITWGDGITDAGTIVSNVDGTFSVQGSHTYAEEGTFTFAVAVTDSGGSTGTASHSIEVADPSVMATGDFSFTGSEGSDTGALTVATFTDPAGPEAVTDYAAMIAWGDGMTSAGVISFNAGNNTFSVTGSHTYSEEGNNIVTVTISHDVSTDVAVTDSIAVADVSVEATGGMVVNGSESGDTGVQPVATFTDPAGAEALSDYSATIDWGDHTTSTDGTITFDSGSGTFTVSGSHTYAEEGAYTVAVTIHHDTAADVTVHSSATVADVPVATMGGFMVSGNEGSDTGSVTVATFTDPAGAEAVGNYSATIGWGDDSTPSDGTITFDSGTGTFTVKGSHLYAEEGTFTITVTIHHDLAADASATSTATIADVSVAAVGVPAIDAVEGAATGSVAVATFTDPGGPEAIGDYSASVDWGDGTTTPGVISVSDVTMVFTVSGNHTYAEEGTHTITTTVHHDTSADVQATSTVDVADAALTVLHMPALGVESLIPSGIATVATFSDANPNATASEFMATIQWGDGTTSPGAIVANADGTFSVQGSHTYTAKGPVTLSVSISDVGGAMASGSAQQVVRANDYQIFVSALYHTVLNRTGSIPEVTGWVNFMIAEANAGANPIFVRTIVSQAFWESGEHRGIQVDGYYQLFFGRAESVFERQIWISAFLGGLGELQVQQLFIDSPEYQNLHPTDQAFIDSLYQKLYGRMESGAELQGWLNFLGAGGSRHAVATAFLTSAEEYAKVVDGYYVDLLGRTTMPPASNLEVANWVNFLLAGGTRETVAEQFLGSLEYYGNAISHDP
jgi:hypothetical protein